MNKLINFIKHGNNCNNCKAYYCEKTSYEYDEWEEYYDYRYADEYRPNKKYSERFAPSCWCIETDFSPEHIKLIDECFCNIKQD